MKNILALLVVSTLLFSCGKYEEGPGISFLTKKNRITNVWSLASRTTNGNTTSLSNTTWTVTINNDDSYNSKATVFGITVLNENGTWKFSNDKLQLQTIPSGLSNTASWDIVRLTKDELKLRYINNNDTIVDTFIGQ